MGQGTALSKVVSIIGGGPAGVLSAILIARSSNFKVRIFDSNKVLSTLLPTGGGRCNLAYYEPDFRELVKFYPRGEKFLLSVFSVFNSLDTISLFEELGIETYIQDDLRIFPISDSAKDVFDKLLKELKKNNVEIIQEMVVNILKNNDVFSIGTDKSSYVSDFVVLATGGKGNGFDLVKKLGHKIEPLKPSLCPLKLSDENFYSLSGVSLSNVSVSAYLNNKKVCDASGDMLFTHNSISGPVVFKISALCAYLDFNKNSPLTLKVNISGLTETEIDSFINENISTSPNKAIKNVFSKIVNKNLLNLILNKFAMDEDKQIVHLSKNERLLLTNALTALELEVTGMVKGGEIVTAGGVCLDEINAKTMESKLIKGLYFTGEIINVDGFTGGFNLQNCWSTAYICSKSLSFS